MNCLTVQNAIGFNLVLIYFVKQYVNNFFYITKDKKIGLQSSFIKVIRRDITIMNANGHINGRIVHQAEQVRNRYVTSSGASLQRSPGEWYCYRVIGNGRIHYCVGTISLTCSSW